MYTAPGSHLSRALSICIKRWTKACPSGIGGEVPKVAPFGRTAERSEDDRAEHSLPATASLSEDSQLPTVRVRDAARYRGVVTICIHRQSPVAEQARPFPTKHRGESFAVYPAFPLLEVPGGVMTPPYECRANRSATIHLPANPHTIHRHP